MFEEIWRASLACAQATAETMARGGEAPHAAAIGAMMAMWKLEAASAADDPQASPSPLEDKLRSFLPLAYKAASHSDAQWSGADLYERLSAFMAALFAAQTHPPAEIAAAMRVVAARAFQDQSSDGRKETYYLLVVAMGAVIVFTAPWILGWPQVILGMAATDIFFSTTAKSSRTRAQAWARSVRTRLHQSLARSAN